MTRIEAGLRRRNTKPLLKRHSKTGFFTANHAKNANKGKSAFAYFGYFAVIQSGFFVLLKFLAATVQARLGIVNPEDDGLPESFDAVIFCHAGIKNLFFWLH
jgi:hypothetical protein